MASVKSDPLSAKFLPPKGTVDVNDKQAIPKQTSKRWWKSDRQMVVSEVQWKLMWICLTLIFVLSMLLVSVAWIIFPTSCPVQRSSSWHISKREILSSNGNLSSKRILNTEQIPTDAIETQRETTTYTPFVERNEWSTEWTYSSRKLKLPVAYVVLNFTNTNNCFTQDECSDIIKGLQQFYIGERWSDIVYNFLVGGDGRVYVGRGWEYVNGIFLKRKPTISIGIIGGCNLTPLPKIQLDAIQQVIEVGIKTGKILSDYKIVQKKNQFNSFLHGLIENWPHCCIIDN